MLLLVDDEQPQVVEPDVLAYQAVSAYHHVDFARLDAADDLALLRRLAHPAQIFHAAGEVLQAFAEGVEMLEGQHRGGHQDGHLLVVAHGLERRAHRQLGLAEAHVAAHKAVHGRVLLHVGLDGLGGLVLVGRVFVEERRLELVLHERVGRKGEAGLSLALGIERNQVAGNVLDLVLGLLLELAPGRRPQLADGGLHAVLAPIFADAVERVDADEERIVVAEDEADRLVRAAVLFGVHKAGEAPDAVVDVDHIVAGVEARQVLERQRLLSRAHLFIAQRIFMVSLENLMVGIEAQLLHRVHKSAVQRHVQLAVLQAPAAVGHDGAQAFELPAVVGQDVDHVALLQAVVDVVFEQVEILVEDGLRRGAEVEHQRLVVGGDAEAELHHGKAAEARCQLGAAHIVGHADGGLVGCGGHAHAGEEGVGLRLHLPAVLDPQLAVVGQDVEERVQVGVRVGAIDVGHDGRLPHLLDRQLRLELEGPDGIDLIAEKVDAERIVGGERKDVDYAAAHRILARLEHEVDALETVFVQHVGHEGDAQPVAHRHLERVARKGRGGYYLFGQRFGIGNHGDGGRGRVEHAAQGLGAQLHRLRVGLAGRRQMPERRRQEEDLLLVEEPRQVVIDVGSLVGVGNHHHAQAPRGRRGCHGHRLGRRRQVLDCEYPPLALLCKAAYGGYAFVGTVERQH